MDEVCLSVERDIQATMTSVKAEPTSPGKPANPLKASSNSKGKERQHDHQDHQKGAGDGSFGMADWVQDYTLLDKMGGDTTMANLGDPVKTIEVGIPSALFFSTAELRLISPLSNRINGNSCQLSWLLKVL